MTYQDHHFQTRPDRRNALRSLAAASILLILGTGTAVYLAGIWNGAAPYRAAMMERARVRATEQDRLSEIQAEAQSQESATSTTASDNNAAPPRNPPRTLTLPVVEPRWLVEPDMSIPASAAPAQGRLRITFDCTLTTTGRLTDCSAQSNSPDPGLARRLAARMSQARLSPLRVGEEARATPFRFDWVYSPVSPRPSAPAREPRPQASEAAPAIDAPPASSPSEPPSTETPVEPVVAN